MNEAEPATTIPYPAAQRATPQAGPRGRGLGHKMHGTARKKPPGARGARRRESGRPRSVSYWRACTSEMLIGIGGNNVSFGMAAARQTVGRVVINWFHRPLR